MSIENSTHFRGVICLGAALLLLLRYVNLTAEDHPPVGSAQDQVKAIATGTSEEADLVKTEIIQARKRTIQSLIAVVTDKKLQQEKKPAVVCAIDLLGELRAEESAPSIAELIDFSTTVNVDAPIMRLPIIGGRDFPAAVALARIGLPSMPQVLEMVRNRGNKFWVNMTAAWVSVRILGPLAETGQTHLILA